jgi:hypothetical protein
LPEVAISRFHRTAERINAEMKFQWNLEVISLFSPDSGSDAAEVSRHAYFAVEPVHPNAQPPAGMFWTPISALTGASFVAREDFEAIQQFLADCRRGPQPFGKPGWFREVSEWVQNEIRSFDLRLNGRFQQFNAAPTFSLVRFETNGVAVWFKAVGEPNLREFGVTLALAQIIPPYVPRLIASRSDWNAWLSLEAEGSELFATRDVSFWEMVAGALARAQLESLSKTQGLLTVGAHDARVASLLKLVDPFFETSSEVMARQLKKTPPALKESEIQNLKEVVKHAFRELKAARVPDTLGHLDLNPRNIIVSVGKCTFLDWAETYVGPPMLSCEYLLEHFRRAFPGDRDGQVRITERYVASWAPLLSPKDIVTALFVAPLLAVFTYAAAATNWRDTRRLAQVERDAYLRSLVRSMKREAVRLAETRHPCRN